MADGKPVWWNDDGVTEVQRVTEDDGNKAEVVRAALQGWNPDDLEWLRVKVNASGELVIAGGGGGGGGGAVTIANGADVVLGTLTDGVWSGSGDATVIALLKALRSLLQNVEFYQQEELLYQQNQTEAQVRLDDAGGGVTYVGKASPGNVTSDPLWQIKKITESAGDITVLWADGENSYDKVWDDRATYTYS